MYARVCHTGVYTSLEHCTIAHNPRLLASRRHGDNEATRLRGCITHSRDCVGEPCIRETAWAHYAISRLARNHEIAWKCYAIARLRKYVTSGNLSPGMSSTIYWTLGLTSPPSTQTTARMCSFHALSSLPPPPPPPPPPSLCAFAMDQKVLGTTTHWYSWHSLSSYLGLIHSW